MSDHDPICQADPLDDIYFCMCEFIGKVRADERERTPVVYGYTAVLSNLRAKVEALPLGFDGHERPTVLLNDVLALIDGDSDD